ncbi:MFS transporter [Microbulbifer epialgicus]|uniref:MFS transporter n=1 Tax=Microbulbifer epialgicus TaxID=393907 RepID=A0ABV4P7F5_9GAMM
MDQRSQFRLMLTRNFSPLFFTQFLGAFNDNVFKSALIVILAFRLAESQANLLINLAAGLFILPFFLFCAIAGQLADKFNKTQLIHYIKLVEICVSALGGYALMIGSSTLCLLALFLFGTQSAFFGPIKYAILPQHLKTSELVGANALVGGGTFVAILLGAIIGTLLAGITEVGENGVFYLSTVIIISSVSGYLFSCLIPPAPAPSPNLKINLNPVSQVRGILGQTAKKPLVFYALFAISWFWFQGTVYFTQIPSFTKNTLSGNEETVTLLLCIFTGGIFMGSLLCERLSVGRIELGIVPLGAAGVTASGISLYIASTNFIPPVENSLKAFVGSEGAVQILFFIALLGVFGGLYIVPIYAVLQERSSRSRRAQIVSMSNILNAFSGVIAALMGVVFLGIIKLDIPVLFLMISLMNLAFVVYVFAEVPEFLIRFLVRFLFSMMCRIKYKGLNKIPSEARIIVVCNEVSFMGVMLISGIVRRPIRFVINLSVNKKLNLHSIFWSGQAAPILYENGKCADEVLKELDQGLENGQVFCFLHGPHVLTNRKINNFRLRVKKFLPKTDISIIPLSVKELWKGVFYCKGVFCLICLPKYLWSGVQFTVGSPVSLNKLNVDDLYRDVGSSKN